MCFQANQGRLFHHISVAENTLSPPFPDNVPIKTLEKLFITGMMDT